MQAAYLAPNFLDNLIQLPQTTKLRNAFWSLGPQQSWLWVTDMRGM